MIIRIRLHDDALIFMHTKKQIKYWCTVGLDKKNSSFLVCMIDAQIMFAQKHKNYVDRCTQIFARINYYIYMHFLCTKKSQFFLPDIEMHKISRCTCLFFLNPICTKVHTHFFVQEKNAHKLIMPILRLTKFMFLYLANNIEKPLFSAGQWHSWYMMHTLMHSW